MKLNNQYVINKLISALNNLSIQELQKLADIFSQSEVERTFYRLIENILSLRKAEHKTKSRKVQKKRLMSIERNETIHLAEVVGRQPHSKQIDFVKSKLFDIFNDKTLLPSTTDVLEVINNYFDCDFNYEDFRKSGRRDLLTKWWKHFEKLPRNTQQKMLETFFQFVQKKPINSEGYRELFRILSRNE